MTGYKKPMSRRISILIPVYNTKPEFLRYCIQSALDQSYKNVEICISDDCSTNWSTLQVLDWAEHDDRVKIVHRKVNGHISAATNSALEIATGEWVAMLDHDDLLHRHAIAEIASAIDRQPTAELVYSDEDKITERGRRFSPFFKPDFSPDLLRSQNYINHLSAYRTSTIRELSGWRMGFEGSQDYDLNLRLIERIQSEQIVHVPKVLYHWRAAKDSTAQSGNRKPYASISARRALEEHNARTGLCGNFEYVAKTQFYKMSPRLPRQRPLASVIIPVDSTKHSLGDIRGLLTCADYAPIEIIVIHQGQDSVTPDSLPAANAFGVVPIFYRRGERTWPAAINAAAATANGQVLCFLGGGVRGFDPSWLGELVAMALQEGVGSVGAKLLWPNMTVHSAGIVVGVGTGAEFSHANFPMNSSGYFSRLRVRHNVSAVSSLCMVARREKFLLSGGFNEQLEMGILNDVDLGLRMRRLGLRHVMCSDVQLSYAAVPSTIRCDEPRDDEAFAREFMRLQEMWGGLIINDPYYSSNHDSSKANFRLGFTLRMPA